MWASRCARKECFLAREKHGMSHQSLHADSDLSGVETEADVTF